MADLIDSASMVKMKTETRVLTPEGSASRIESVAIEAPYRVALNDEEMGASMVLPVGLEEFGPGFLFGQGWITSPGQVKEVYVCSEGRISVYADVPEEQGKKEFIITSGCGGTGKISRDVLEGDLGSPLEYSISFDEIRKFIMQVLKASSLGLETHCVHGCGLWSGGRLQAFYEDVGRHNAVDKVIGAILLGRVPAAGAVYTTGRLTSDMVLKCARIGIPIVMSRTAPSSLGLAIARRAGITLAAYARPDRVNVFHAPERIVS